MISEFGLAWTLVKPPRLTNAPKRRAVQAGAGLRIGLFSSINRISLANFILDAIERGEYIGARVFVKV